MIRSMQEEAWDFWVSVVFFTSTSIGIYMMQIITESRSVQWQNIMYTAEAEINDLYSEYDI
jgi:hypothetical protein